MSIDKALYAAPQGIDAAADHEQPLEIEIENPDSVTMHMDGLEVVIEPGDEGSDEFNANLAEEVSDSALAQLAGDLLGDFDSDISSRKDWIQTYVDGLELLGLKIEERAEPWEGACGVYHPLLAEALVKFQAETMMSIFPAAGPVKTLIIGKETPEKKESAERVQDDMNYQLTECMPEYRPETERMLWGLGLAGNAFKKMYYDPSLERQVAMYVPAEDMVVPYGASDLASSPRVTHVMRKTENELRRLQVSGFYRDVDLGEPMSVLDEVEKKIAEKLGFRATSDDRFKVLEMHVDLDLEGFEDEDDDGNATGIALPYIVTIEKGTQTVLAIRRNWKEDDKLKQKRQHFVHYGYIPGFGFYCFGLIHLIGAYAKSGTSIIRQLVDAGTLANLPGGFKTRGLRVKGDDTPIAPGEWRDVDVPSGALRDNLLPLPYKEPSQTLAALMDKIIEEGRRFANTADLDLSDMSAQAPVGTTLAILERTLKVMSAVQARIHFSLKQELKLLKVIIADYTPEEYDYDPGEGSRRAKKSDYDDVDVIPVSDPNASTMAQKIVQYQAAMQLAQQAPQLYNMPVLHRQMLDVLGIKDAQKLVPLPEDQKPTDPVTENQNILMMKPVKAFAYQDHQAHITVHMSAMQDPKIMQLLQNNPMAQQLQGAMMAHINEHLGFQYRVEIQNQLGFSLPPQTDETGEDVHIDIQAEARLAPMLAQAAQRMLQQNQAQAQQAQAAQQAQDPMVQLQQQELQIKQGELQRKQQKDQADQQLAQAKLQMDAAMRNKELQVEAMKAAGDLNARKAERNVDALKAAGDLNNQRADRHADTVKSAAQLLSTHQQNQSRQNLDALQRSADRHAQQKQHQDKMALDARKHDDQMMQAEAQAQAQAQAQPTEGE
jgi:hypothetical protein